TTLIHGLRHGRLRIPSMGPSVAGGVNVAQLGVPGAVAGERGDCPSAVHGFAALAPLRGRFYQLAAPVARGCAGSPDLQRVLCPPSVRQITSRRGGALRTPARSARE